MKSKAPSSNVSGASTRGLHAASIDLIACGSNDLGNANATVENPRHWTGTQEYEFSPL
jgi:hypothetical protein